MTSAITEAAIACPFCGSNKITVEWEACEPLDKTDTNRRWFAECTQCSCQGPFCQKEPQVIPAWNRRVERELEAVRAERDELKLAQREITTWKQTSDTLQREVEELRRENEVLQKRVAEYQPYADKAAHVAQFTDTPQQEKQP